MTMPSGPTPATLDAAVYILAAELWHDSNPGMPIDADCRAWQECVGMARRAVAAAAPILAATHADRLAQAHAAGTAEGATAERERIADEIDAETDRNEFNGWARHLVLRHRWLAQAIRTRTLGSGPDAAAIEAIARAGTNEVGE